MYTFFFYKRSTQLKKKKILNTYKWQAAEHILSYIALPKQHLLALHHSWSLKHLVQLLVAELEDGSNGVEHVTLGSHISGQQVAQNHILEVFQIGAFPRLTADKPLNGTQRKQFSNKNREEQENACWKDCNVCG